MDEDIHEYESEDVTVAFDSNRCIHARECVRGLPAVFDADRRPWIDPEAADADEIAVVVERCPTGALQYERHDDGAAEEPPTRNTVTVVADGPLYLRGDIALETPDGDTLLTDTRVGLCRCGHSENKPLCDNSHERVFEAAGTPPETAAVVDDGGDGDGETAEADDGDGERLTVRLSKDGPFVLDGSYDLRERADDVDAQEGGALCRCGQSGGKPFCDRLSSYPTDSTATSLWPVGRQAVLRRDTRGGRVHDGARRVSAAIGTGFIGPNVEGEV